MPRRNRLRELLKENRPLIGSQTLFQSPTFVEYLGLAGFDWVWIEAEHSGMSVETCYSLVTAADAVGLGTVVRVRSQDPETYITYAETGPNALLVPHLNNAEEAKTLASKLQFPPYGARGISGNTRAANHGFGQSAADYFADTENRMLFGGMIEEESAVENLDSILAVDGLDIFCIGPSDLAGSMGVPGRPNTPAVQERIREAAGKLKAANRTFICTSTSPETSLYGFSLGASMVNVSAGGVVRNTLTSFIEAVSAGLQK